MADQAGKARGRGRGRAAAAARGGGGGPPAGPGGPTGPRGAWGPPPVASQQAPAPAPQRAPVPPQGGRATSVTQKFGEMKIGGGESSARPSEAPVRGNMRGGGRNIAEKYLFLRTRPEGLNSKQGTNGSAIRLLSNYFKIKTHPKWCLYQYRVDISPEEDRTAVRKGLLKSHAATLGGYIFDGTVLYTPHRLNPDPTELYSKRADDDQTMKLTLKLVGDLAPGDHGYIQVFNILMRRCYENLKLELIGRDYFDPNSKIDIHEHRLQIWPGYKTTIAQYENDILMVAEVAHKVVRMDTVLDVLRKQSVNQGPNMRNDFQAEIIGSIILTDYNNKTYRIDDVRWDLNPRSKFIWKGQDSTYADYYMKKYKIPIRDSNQPLLVSRSKPRDIRAGAPELFHLIPEVCRMTGLTPEMKNNNNLMREMAKHTRVAPDTRVQKLLNFNRRLLTTREIVDDLSKWDMAIDNTLVELGGRVLEDEVILQGPNGEMKYSAGGTYDGWTRELRSKKLLSVGRVERWAVIVPQRMRRDTENFVNMIMKTGGAMGFHLPNPTFHEIPNDQIGVYLDKLEHVISQTKPNIIVCAVSNDRSERYAAIKKKCLVDRAMITQVLTNRCITNKNAMSIATKVAIQMNCKLGGAAWTVNVPLKHFMVIGFDVCHDTNDKSKSFGCMVASLDKGMTRYFSTVTPHNKGEELSNAFSINILKALHKYKEFNGNVLPSHIIIYRDGVGEGQIPYVYEHEVNMIRNKLAEIYNGNNYKLGFIIVTKRLNTRFFLKGNMANPRPGTIIDDVVTSPERYDFFLVSQAVREGTVSPTSYNVIFDSLGWSPDHIQRLTYKCCHTYFNISSQSRVPAPCQYAHKLAFMAGQFLHMSPNPGLETLLYFL